MNEEDCSELHSGFGSSVDCSTQSSYGLTVHRLDSLHVCLNIQRKYHINEIKQIEPSSCSSGRLHDCPLNNGDWDTNRVDCCTTSFANGMALGTTSAIGLLIGKGPKQLIVKV